MYKYVYMDKSEFKLPDFKVHAVGTAQALSQIYPQGVKDLKIPSLWKLTKGEGVVVAVLDTGCPKKHPDLSKNIDLSKCKSFISNEDIFDSFVGHGTHCSGTIAAIDNNQGIVGVAPDATIVSIKVLNRNGFGEDDSVINGLKYCLELKPDIINMSLGSPNPSSEMYKIIKKINALNIPIVCSAGNAGTEGVLYPANYDECIAVGSYSNSTIRGRSLFSSWGETLDIMAPGEEVLSTYLDGQYSVMSGTSMSSPHVSGVIALMISYYKKLNKTLTVDEIKSKLFSTAIDIKKAGKDKETGWGIINPEKLFGTAGTPPPKKSFWQKIKGIFGK